ncbi:excinuclease ABC subunit A [Gallaecimonas sp. GXIMD4217]|uniref:excinuclease ABC subunit A n=1 Tax=Gallaecimonas sp. GXIMD4217 TaxID=3131927 RepID=UPI00311AE57F
MKSVLSALAITLALTSAAQARDTIGNYDLKETMALEQTRTALGEDVAFYFGDQSYGKVAKDFGEYRTNKKTNAFNKSDKEACQWVFLSAMKSLKDRAIAEGGNAVVEIKSNYRNNLTKSSETFQCGAGTFVAGVALVGKVVKLDK